MNDDQNLADEDRGLYPKYRAIKIDHDHAYLTDGQGIKIGGFPQEEVTEPFFLLKFDDPHAVPALRAYARSCKAQFPQLAQDIEGVLRDIRDGKHALTLEQLREKLGG